MSTKESEKTLKEANFELRSNNIRKAIKLYKEVLEERPDLERSIRFNLSIALNKLKKNDPHLATSAIEHQKKSKIAVVVHVFYEHLWARTNEYLSNIETEFDLIITTPIENIDTLSEKVIANHPLATIIAVENEGMDVLPFITAVSKLKLWRYDAVLKLHTKNNKTEDREIQGKMLLDGVLGSRRLVNEIIRTFSENKEVGLIGSETLFRSGDLLMYNNREIFREILAALEIKETDSDFGFIAGTVFWVKGCLLRVFDENYTALKQLLSKSKISKTGADGTHAHAFERVFGILPSSQNLKVAVSYPLAFTPLEYGLKIVENSSIDKNPIYRAGSTIHVLRYKNIQEWAKAISQSDFFDPEYYKKQLPIKSTTDQSISAHYILHGDLFSANPSQNFNSRYYLTRYKDIARSRTPALVHFINHGNREGRVGQPEDKDWIELAFREGLLNTEWVSRKEEVENILRESDPEKYMEIYSKNFIPHRIPRISYMTRTHNGLEIIKTYLDGIYQDELELFDLLERNWSNSDHIKSRELANTIGANYGDSRAALEVLGSCDLILRNWDEARRTWKKYWDLIHCEQGIPERCKKSILRIDQPTEDNEDFNIIDPNKKTHEKKEKNNKICVYTTLFGDIDNLLPIISGKQNIDFICFTDRPREDIGWEQRVVSPEYDSPNLSAKTYKILPHKYLAEYTHSLFVDANTLFLGRLDLLIKTCLSSGSFVMWRHPFRRDVYKECAAIITSKRHEPNKIINQIRKYSDDGLPNDTGLTEGSFIWRSHTDKQISQFMDSWWNEIITESSRDQISLGYLMWRTKIKPDVFPNKLGSSRSNIFFVKVPHNFEVSKRSDKTAGMVKKKRNIIFLYSEKYANSGSTVMRGKQLSSLIKEHFSGRREVTYSANAGEIKNSILFLTKGYIKDSSISDLERLKSAGNILLCDFVDDIPDKEKVDIVDALIASSISSYKYYMTSMAHIPSFHITHHVDPRILRKIKDHPREFISCEIGYFGELLNTQYEDKINHLVSFHNVDTSKQETSWIKRVTDYNCHYAVRKRRGIDGFKPFLKGFTAAATGSNIIIQENEGDTAYYLGHDYPYLVSETPSEDEVISLIHRIKDGYKSTEWNYALSIMQDVNHRSSNNHIISEFESLIKEVE